MTPNKQNSPILLLYLPLILALVSLACGLSEALANLRPTSEPLPTRRPALPTFTPPPPDSNFIEVEVVNTDPEEVIGALEQSSAEAESATATLEPSPTPTPEPTATPTPADPTVTILQNMNVRGGPGTNYPVIGPGPAGESAKIIGRNADSSWVQIQYPIAADGIGWVYAPLVQIDGNLETVAVAQAPPPPAPVVVAEAPPAEEQPPAPPPEPEKKYQFTPTGWHASGNEAIVHFKGRIIDEHGNLINGFSVLVDNWAWGVLSHPTGASHHYPEKGDGEWDVIIPKENIGDGVGWWWLTVVSYDCPDFLARFDAQCKQFTRRSEDVKIQVNWPDETIINADWICHWDCNKAGGSLYEEAYRRP